MTSCQAVCVSPSIAASLEPLRYVLAPSDLVKCKSHFSVFDDIT